MPSSGLAALLDSLTSLWGPILAVGGDPSIRECEEPLGNRPSEARPGRRRNRKQKKK